MLIHIKNLRLRTIIGIFDWEREAPQDVVINAQIAFDGERAARSDAIDDTYDYKTATKRVISLVESSQFFLLERLAAEIRDVLLDHPLVEHVRVEVDKPGALRFSDSVSVTCEGRKGPEAAGGSP